MHGKEMNEAAFVEEKERKGREGKGRQMLTIALCACV